MTYTNPYKAKVETWPDLPHAPRYTWEYKRAQIRKHILQDDKIEEFLRWSTIQESFFVGNTRSVQKIWDELPQRFRDVLKDPGIGSPPELFKGTTGTFIVQAWYLYSWERFTGRQIDDLKCIVEYGGGYGALALIARRLGFQGVFVIVDVPESHLLQEYYLARAHVYGIELSQQYIGHTDLLIGACSFSEVSVDLRDRALAHIKWDHNMLVYQPTFLNVPNDEYFLSKFSDSAFVKDDHTHHWFVIK